MTNPIIAGIGKGSFQLRWKIVGHGRRSIYNLKYCCLICSRTWRVKITRTYVFTGKCNHGIMEIVMLLKTVSFLVSADISQPVPLKGRESILAKVTSLTHIEGKSP